MMRVLSGVLVRTVLVIALVLILVKTKAKAMAKIGVSRTTLDEPETGVSASSLNWNAVAVGEKKREMNA